MPAKRKTSRPRKTSKKSKSRSRSRPRKTSTKRKSRSRSRKSHSRSSRSRPRKTSRTSHRFLGSRGTQNKLGECRGRAVKTCESDPNCTYRRNTGCVRKRSRRGKTRFYGPTLPNFMSDVPSSY